MLEPAIMSMSKGFKVSITCLDCGNILEVNTRKIATVHLLKADIYEIFVQSLDKGFEKMKIEIKNHLENDHDIGGVYDTSL